MSANLNDPITYPISNITASNRIALAPMTNTQSHSDGRLSHDEADWLKMRVDGGFGTIITAGAYVDRLGKSWDGQIGIHNQATAESFLPLTDSFRKSSSIGVLQLFHGGMRAMHDANTNLSPSGGTNSRGERIARKMNTQEIHNAIDAYVEAAYRSKQSGFHGVEIHGAHGYLIHQFLSTETNQRKDDWGGNSSNRERFLLSIVRGIRERCGDNFLVGVRLSPEDANWFHGIDFDACIDLSCRLAEDEGVDYIHISLWDAFKAADKYPNEGPAITHFKKALPQNMPLMTAGKVWRGEDAEEIRSYGADIVALGRVAIAHPNWVKEYLNNNDYKPDTPPFSVDYLKKAGLNPAFVEYMKKWKGFVKD